MCGKPAMMKEEGPLDFVFGKNPEEKRFLTDGFKL